MCTLEHRPAIRRHPIKCNCEALIGCSSALWAECSETRSYTVHTLRYVNNTIYLVNLQLLIESKFPADVFTHRCVLIALTCGLQGQFTSLLRCATMPLVNECGRMEGMCDINNHVWLVSQWTGFQMPRMQLRLPCCHVFVKKDEACVSAKWNTITSHRVS